MRLKLLFGILLPGLFQALFAQNPELFKDIAPFPYGSKPGSFAVLGNKLLFAANNYVGSSTNRELFVSDGTPNGTQLLLDLNAGNSSSSPEKLINLYGKVYFAMADNSFGPLVYRPWVTDGTAAGTIPLFPNPTNALGSTLGIISLFKPDDLFVAYKGSVYFMSSKPTAPYDRVIYKTNGTQAGTSIAMELPNSNMNVPNLMNGPMVYKDSLFFSGTSNGAAFENFYKSAGTTASIRLVKTDVNIRPWNGWAVYNKKLYFVGNTFAGTSGDDPWVTDGSASGTMKATDLQAPGVEGGEPKCFTRLNNKLVFLGNPTLSSVALYAFDSLSAGNQLSQLAITSPTSLPFTSDWLFKSKNKVYFRGNDNINATELWTSDGTTVGTKMVKDINPGLFPSDPHTFVEYCDGVYFTARNPVSGTSQALYKTDGTAAGTVLIPGTSANPLAGSSITDKVVFQNSLFYSGQYETNLLEELYKYTANCATNTEAISFENELLAYPNPSSDWINIQANKGNILTYQIKNILGQQVDHQKIESQNEFRIDLSSFTNGVYFLDVKTLKGNRTLKIIKN